MDEKKVPHLIEEIHRRPVIWNKTLAEHNNKTFVGSEWNKIAANINVLKASAQNKWKALKKKFQAEHSRTQLHRSGDGLEDAYQSTWPHYVSLSFLADCAVPKPSTGSLDCLFDVKPAITKPKEKSVQSTDLDSNPVTPGMDKKEKDIAEHLLAITERQKWQLMEGSMCNIPQVDNTAVVDKQNKAFLETLLPTLREVRKEDVLLCRADITRIVFNYAYKGVPWKSINDSSKTPKPNSPVRPKKKRFTNQSNDDDDDDDVQILKCFKLQDTLPIKVEKKYQPSAAERVIERNSNDARMQRSGYNQWVSDPRPPPSWDPRYYEQQVPPQYYGPNVYGQRFIPRQPLTPITYPPNIHHGMNIGMGPIATNTTNDGSSERFPIGRQDEFQTSNENQSAARTTITSTGVGPQTANADNTVTQSITQPTMTPTLNVVNAGSLPHEPQGLPHNERNNPANL